MDQLHAMADALMKYETIDKNQIQDIMTGKKVRQPDNWVETTNKGSGSSAKDDKTTAKRSAAKSTATRTRRKKVQNDPTDKDLIVEGDPGV